MVQSMEFSGAIVAAIIVLLISLFGLSATYAASVVAAGLMAIITVLIFAVIVGGSHRCHRWDHRCFIKKDKLNNTLSIYFI